MQMSINPPDELFLVDDDSFSIAKIDETIARSKRIVQESLAISKSLNEKSKNLRKASSKINYEVDSSAHEDSDYSARHSSFANEYESENRIKNTCFAKEKFKKSFEESQILLKELEAQEKIRNNEISRLQSTLSLQNNAEINSLQQSLQEKKQKIKELSDKITNSAIFRENQELKAKIRQFEMKKLEKNSRTPNIEENDKKKEIDAHYNALYKLHQETSLDVAKEVQKLREEIKNKEKENTRNILYLTSKLEEKMIDNQLLSDQIKSLPSRYSDHSYKAEETINESSNKKIRRYSNHQHENEINEYKEKIVRLETELKKVKLKYSNLKKLYQKNCRKQSCTDGKRTVIKTKKRTASKKKVINYPI
ncbi:hypothetical protein SteCoe_14353 [Stentor coeruleus]|uniref:Uncharacterized protein n=1 Tax=Stentor coeruleus TaxID=5963 RepID=A0A1R2C689_9CILI|nr:hypothetical protein SteCoe_14353 [Stentor coeruleus]